MDHSGSERRLCHGIERRLRTRSQSQAKACIGRGRRCLCCCRRGWLCRRLCGSRGGDGAGRNRAGKGNEGSQRTHGEMLSGSLDGNRLRCAPVGGLSLVQTSGYAAQAECSNCDNPGRWPGHLLSTIFGVAFVTSGARRNPGRSRESERWSPRQAQAQHRKGDASPCRKRPSIQAFRSPQTASHPLHGPSGDPDACRRRDPPGSGTIRVAGAGAAERSGGRANLPVCLLLQAPFPGLSRPWPSA